MIFATECENINQSWIEEFPEYCSASLLIYFVDKFNVNKTGFLTKYDGLISDYSSIDDCQGNSTFSLPQSMSILVRSKNRVSKKEYKGAYKALEMHSKEINIFLSRYQSFFSDVYIFFARDVFMLCLFLVIFFFNFDKKKFIVLINFVISKIMKKIESDQDEESAYLEYVTIADLENRLTKTKEGLVDYIDLRVFEVRETLKKNKIESTIKFHSVNENMNFIKALDNDSMTYTDMQKTLKSKRQKASGTKAELKERLYHAISEDLQN